MEKVEITTKKCSKCGEVKPVGDFGKHKSSKNGIRSECLKCAALYSQSYRKKNPEQTRAASRKWRLDNPDRAKELDTSNYAENRERYLRHSANWREKNSEKDKRRQVEYRISNRARMTAIQGKRKASKIRATPKWADDDAIQDMYSAALAFRLYTGQEYHVDHIVPLQGKTVCGLHVEYNLQVLPASDNCSKCNRC